VVEPYPEERDLKELISEHEALRREILHNETVIMQTLTSTMVIVGAIMGFAFSNVVTDLTVKSFLFFSTEGIIAIAMIQSVDKARLFTEAKLHHLKWETRLSEFRKLHQKKGYGGLIANQLWIYALITLANFGCGAFYAIQSFSSSPIAIFFLGCGLIITICLITYVRMSLNKYVYRHTETFEPVWTAIRAKEEQAINESILTPTAPLKPRFHRLRRFFR
jgi:hypothetical protein